MNLHSSAFENDSQLPRKYTNDGDNVSPPLAWDDVPDGTAELALVMESSTGAVRSPYTRWLVYGIPPEASGMPEGLQETMDKKKTHHILDGKNSKGNTSYEGPSRKDGEEISLTFRLHALDQRLNLTAGATHEDLNKAIEGHVLEIAELECRY